jgi:tape measure domain-containing protein
VAQAQIVITAETKQAQAAIGNLNKALGGVNSASKQAELGLNSLSSTTKLAVGAFAALTASFGVREIVNITSAYTDLNSRLVNATGSQEMARKAMEAISRTADATYSSLEQTAEVFLRNSMALNELGYTTNEQIKVSEVLNNALAVSATRGQAAASVLDAFAKSMARGKIQGDDFNRIVENSPRLVKALADGLGVTTAELRNMASEGKLTSDIVIPALTSQMSVLREEAAAMPATINDAFIIFRNSLVKMIAGLDEATGASTKVADVLVTVARNLDIVAVAAGTFMLVMAAPRILAMAKAMLIFNAAMAKNPLVLLALGAAAAATAIYEFFFASEKATDAASELAKEIERQNQELKDQEAAMARAAAAQAKLVKEQTLGLQPLFDKIKLESDSIGLNQRQLAIKKNISDAAKELKVEEDKITQSLKQRIIDDTNALMLKKETHSITKVITDLETERFGLAVQDKNQREIALAIRAKELEFGRALNENERARLTNSIQLTQQAREQAAIAEFLNDATRKQTELEKLQRGLQLQAQVDPRGSLQKQFERDLQALTAYHQATNTSTADALAQRRVLEEEFHYKMLELQNQQLQNYDRINKLKEQMDLERIQKTLMNERGAVAAALSEQDRAMLQRQGMEERQRKIVQDRIEFEKKSDSEKTQFALTNLQSIFSTLGAQNKKAFEANKALAIASALVNTYQGATKALATYPWPFGLIAAAGAVAAGMAQVAAIRSQQYSGRQLGGPVMGGQQYIVGENGPEVFTPNTTGSITRNRDAFGGAGAVTVNFNINAVDAQGVDELLIERRGTITQIISDAMLEKGQRL